MNFKEFQTEQKLRGGYYTPEDLANFLAEWVSVINPSSILEPSCGDGNFLPEIARYSPKAKTLCFELDEEEAGKAKNRAADIGLASCEIHNTDFLGWAIQQLKNNVQCFDGG